MESHSACKNSNDLDSGRMEEKGVPANNMEENGTRRDVLLLVWVVLQG